MPTVVPHQMGCCWSQPFQGEDVSLSGTLKKDAIRLSLMHCSVEWRLSSGQNLMGYDTMCIMQSISKLAEMMAINISRSSSGWLRRWRKDWTGPCQRCPYLVSTTLWVEYIVRWLLQHKYCCTIPAISGLIYTTDRRSGFDNCRSMGLPQLWRTQRSWRD